MQRSRLLFLYEPSLGSKQKTNMKITKLSIIIPAYNEERTIHFILDKVKDVNLINGITKEVIIVNDCSTDDTENAIENYITTNPSLEIHYFKHEYNKGKGAALHT
jgi:glycosyltransferase involved in cell wall biosynthesis